MGNLGNLAKVTFANANPRGGGDNRLNSIPAKAKHLNDLVDRLDVTNAGLFVSASKYDDGPTTRTLTAAENNSIFLIDDAATTWTLPDVSNELVGWKTKIIATDVNSTGLVINSQAATHYFIGYAILTAAATVTQTFLPNGTDDNVLTLNGTTKGGLQTGATGDTMSPNTVTFTCIKGSAGAAWFVEATLYGSGTLATPFS